MKQDERNSNVTEFRKKVKWNSQLERQIISCIELEKVNCVLKKDIVRT